MQRLKWRRSMCMVIAAVITFGGTLTGSPQSHTNEADLSKVRDILGHQRHHLLRHDDLVISFGSGEIIRNTVLRTTHSSISKEGPAYEVGSLAPVHWMILPCVLRPATHRGVPSSWGRPKR